MRTLLAAAKEEINREAPDYFMRVNEGDYVAHLKEKYTIDPLKIDLDNITVAARETEVDSRYGGRGRLRMQVVTFHVPYSGDSNLLGCAPNPSQIWGLEVDQLGDSFTFEVEDASGDMSGPKRELELAKRNITANQTFMDAQVNGFNTALEQELTGYFRVRKADLLKKSSALETLGVPIKRAEHVSTTFSVPTVRRKVVIKPSAPSEKIKPTPVLDPRIYEAILQIIFDMGRSFERLPNTYKDKGENALRDHFLMMLEQHFEGASATGETFNKNGKTDILIRYENANVFVAECKFWKGKAQHYSTIDQLLSYLTFRDSKTAIIYFVDRKDMTSVLAEIDKETPTHPRFVKRLVEKDPSWKEFEFSLDGDPQSRITLTILAFHLAK
jgi:hypothetical protein